MYIPEHFNEKNPEIIQDILDASPLATFITTTLRGDLVANHLPVLVDNVDGNYTVLAHISNNNEMLALNNQPVLITFLAQDSYISPNWYPSKGETHKAVPTWNYQAIHMRGQLEVLPDDKKLLLNIIGRLTKFHEHAIGEQQPWKMTDAPADFMEQLLAVITPIRVRVNHIDVKSKINQNRSLDDRVSVRQHMERLNKLHLAQHMQRHE